MSEEVLQIRLATPYRDRRRIEKNTLMYMKPKKEIRVAPGFGPNPARIIPGIFDGKCIRSVRWTIGGKKYALGYDHYPRLFGERQRKIRSALLMSVENTIKMVGL